MGQNELKMLVCTAHASYQRVAAFVHLKIIFVKSNTLCSKILFQNDLEFLNAFFHVLEMLRRDVYISNDQVQCGNLFGVWGYYFLYQILRWGHTSRLHIKRRTVESVLLIRSQSTHVFKEPLRSHYETLKTAFH